MLVVEIVIYKDNGIPEEVQEAFPPFQQRQSDFGYFEIWFCRLPHITTEQYRVLAKEMKRDESLYTVEDEEDI